MEVAHLGCAADLDLRLMYLHSFLGYIGTLLEKLASLRSFIIDNIGAQDSEDAAEFLKRALRAW